MTTRGAGAKLFVGGVVAALLGCLSATSEAASSPASSSGDSDSAIEKRGCCSHHKGVCGCSGHTTMCCDQTASPSCTC